MTKPDILHHLFLHINCHFLLEKTKLKSLFISWSGLRHLLMCVKVSVTVGLGFSLEDSKWLDFMKYVFECVSRKDCVSTFYF